MCTFSLSATRRNCDVRSCPAPEKGAGHRQRQAHRYILASEQHESGQQGRVAARGAPAKGAARPVTSSQNGRVRGQNRVVVELVELIRAVLVHPQHPLPVVPIRASLPLRADSENARNNFMRWKRRRKFGEGNGYGPRTGLRLHASPAPGRHQFGDGRADIDAAVATQVHAHVSVPASARVSTQGQADPVLPLRVFRPPPTGSASSLGRA